MARKTTPVSGDDAALFRDAIGEVRRIEPAPAPPVAARPAPRPRRLEFDEAEALRESRVLSGDAPPDGDEMLAFRRDNVSERTLKRLRRGEFSVGDEIDLHHLRALEAEQLLRRFLSEARSGENRCVRIVHGKGLRSEGAPVLKQLVDRMLRHRGDVLAFASAPPNQGGAGAVLVLLA